MRKELYAALLAGVPEVQWRIYPLILPQDTKKNSIVYHVLGTMDTTGITCTTPINTRYAVQIDVLTTTYEESVVIMEKVKTVLRKSFLAFNITSFEDYANITVKYRQIIDLQLELK